ncbi:hypothetical protein [Bifidobacterium longum]|uniref:hypothetical protein n=1 Tax=Bifidobacterium longum TaxID=216816 RepID=UPI00186711F6|nr:hypothetical protein [Bifidobacterium longum]QOL29966.1 hypothetical protein BL5934_10150 [Bifidobacterium longum subsp. infantis]
MTGLSTTARNADDELYVGTEQRVMRIDPLYYAEGGLDPPGPTAAAQAHRCMALCMMILRMA